jgi:spore coat polysaccharide biosynthesis protein SpsF
VISAIIQARMSSTRLPGKTMMNLEGRPLIGHVVDRIVASDTMDQVILATSDAPADDVLAAWAKSNGIFCYRGSENDVLDRYYGAALACKASIIARVTADDPFKDPTVLDRVVRHLQEHELDFAYNNKPPSFPEGLDTEVFTFAALEQAANMAQDPFEREHVTQYFYRHPHLFRQKNIACDRQLSHLRWTIDTAADFRMAQAVYEKLYTKGDVFLMDDVLALYEVHPEIAAINSNEQRSSMYR